MQLAADAATGAPEAEAWTRVHLALLDLSRGRPQQALKQARAALVFSPAFHLGLDALAQAQAALGNLRVGTRSGTCCCGACAAAPVRRLPRRPRARSRSPVGRASPVRADRRHSEAPRRKRRQERPRYRAVQPRPRDAPARCASTRSSRPCRAAERLRRRRARVGTCTERSMRRRAAVLGPRLAARLRRRRQVLPSRDDRALPRHGARLRACGSGARSRRTRTSRSSGLPSQGGTHSEASRPRLPRGRRARGARRRKRTSARKLHRQPLRAARGLGPPDLRALRPRPGGDPHVSSATGRDRRKRILAANRERSRPPRRRLAGDAPSHRAPARIPAGRRRPCNDTPRARTRGPAHRLDCTGNAPRPELRRPHRLERDRRRRRNAERERRAPRLPQGAAREPARRHARGDGAHADVRTVDAARPTRGGCARKHPTASPTAASPGSCRDATWPRS